MPAGAQDPDPADAATPPLIWTRVGASGRGRAPSLRHDDIARVGVEIARAEGLGAVTMRRVAGELGVGTMSLYRYVASRDDIVELMVDRTVGELTLPDSVAGDWRAVLDAIGRGVRRLVLRHTWMTRHALGTRPAFGPNTLDWVERTQAALDRPDLTVDQLLDMTGTVTQFVLGHTQGELAEQEEQRRTGLTEEQWRARLAPWVGSVLARGEHPQLERIIRDAEDFPDPDAVFERRLGYVIEGIGAGLGLA